MSYITYKFFLSVFLSTIRTERFHTNNYILKMKLAMKMAYFVQIIGILY